MLLLTLLGAVLGFLTVATQTVLQIASPISLRGRVFGLFHTVISALAPLSFAAAGVLGELRSGDVGAVFVASGIAMSALALWLFRRRELSELLAVRAAGEPSR